MRPADYRYSNFVTDPDEEACPERKILYKLISGLHSSISIHIGADYLLDEATNLVLHLALTRQPLPFSSGYMCIWWISFVAHGHPMQWFAKSRICGHE